MKVGIFGAHGKFGTALHSHLKSLDLKGVELMPTRDRLHNVEIAKESDLAIITARSHEVESLLKEIAPALKETSQVLSFAAYYPLHSISKHSGRNAGRAMSDPWWNMAAFCLKPKFQESGLDFLLSDMSRLSPQRLGSDSEIDDFTILASYLFGVLLLDRCGDIGNIDTHLSFLAERLRYSQDELLSCLPEGNPQDLLTMISTKGGITERIVTLIREQKDIQPVDIVAKLLKQN